jgi:putative ABC transport system permease protein
MLWSSLLLALREIRRNLIRAALTVLGIVIGVAAVITMVTLGTGATRAVQDQISSIGTNLLMVRPGQRMGLPEGAPNFKLADAEAIAAHVSSAHAVAPVAMKSTTVIRQAKNWATAVTGTTGAYFTIGNWQLADGRVFSETEERSGKAVCVIGETVRRQLFGSENPV